MRENGREEENGKTEALRAKSLFTGQKVHFTVYTNGLYSHQDKKKILKTTKAFNCYKDKMGRNQKMNKKEKLQTGSRNSTWQDEQCA